MAVVCGWLGYELGEGQADGQADGRGEGGVPRDFYDYTLGFALSDRTSASEQRLQDTTTRHKLHAFLQSLPTDRFPVLAAIGEYVWLDDRDQRFTASLHTLISGLQAAQSGPRHPRH